MGKQITINDVKNLAIKMNGKSLSSEYKNNQEPLIWECKDGHQWKASYSNVSRGTWCKECALIKRKTGLLRLQEYAKSHGGECLSEKYINSTTHIHWRCKNGHEWLATSSSVLSGKWCKKCWYSEGLGSHLRKHNILEAKEYAQTKGGDCLSKTFESIKHDLEWQCKNGHKWMATYSSVVNRGTWCIVCANNLPKTIHDAVVIATQRNGFCLSDKIKNNKSRLKWKCQDGHEWEATFLNVSNGSWCPYCTKYISEEKCRYIFESIFSKPFKKRRDVLGNRWELDGYNEELRLAFEYHGQQHYKIVPLLTPTKEDLNNRKHQDYLKENRCSELGITLVSIPYTSAKSDESLVAYIFEKLGKFVESSEGKEISWQNFYDSLSVLKSLNNLAITKGGKCLATSYNNSMSPILWECANGHQWLARPNNIQNGTWCPECAGKVTFDIETLKLYASSHGGRLLSDEASSYTQALSWECSNGHLWTAPFGRLKQRNTFCPKCSFKARVSKVRLSIEIANNIAKSYGGACLSSAYDNSKEKLQWSCKNGHKFEKSINQITSRDSWCPICSRASKSAKKTGVKRKFKLTITDMQAFAKQHNGICLSSDYKNNKILLEWKCEKGHQWQATAGYVKLGNWCPECKSKS